LYYTPSGRSIQKPLDAQRPLDAGQFELSAATAHANRQTEFHTDKGRKVTGGGGTFNGSLVAASFGYGSSGGTEFHNFIFTSGTPEPAPIACVGLGLIALACVRRRRRRA